MTAKRTAKPKKLPSLKQRLAILNRDYRFVPHTNAGRLSSTVRRMKAEKEMEIPIRLRSGAAISVKRGKAANKMAEPEWEEFYGILSQELRRLYPEICSSIFPNDSDVPPAPEREKRGPRRCELLAAKGAGDQKPKAPQSVAASSPVAKDERKEQLALSVRQPHAEAILRGVKKIEYRKRQTAIRGRIYIYAGLKRYAAKEEASMMAQYGIKGVACDDLPRGVVVGTVELYDCDGGDWHVRKPQRAKRLVKPKSQPQPIWFRPF